MQDVKLELQSNSLYDLVIDMDKKDFASVEGFDTTILVNLFTDARADEDEAKNASRRRGWIMNILRDYELGSKNWLFDQERITQDVLNRLKISTLNAFQYMIDTKQLEKIDVSVTETDNNVVKINLFLVPTQTEPVNYSILWKKTDQGY